MNWISTIEPAPWRIAGYDLGPLLFGHCTLFELFRDGDKITALDLWRYLNIASRSHKEAREWLTRDINATFSIRRWAFLKTVGQMPRFAEVLTAWNAYLEENTSTPEVLISVEGTETRGAPYLQTLFTIAATRLNYDPQTICDAQFGQLIWSVLAFNESQGGIRIIDDNLSQALENLKCRNSS